MVQWLLSQEKGKNPLHHGMVALGQLIRILFKTKIKHAVIKCKIEMQNYKSKNERSLLTRFLQAAHSGNFRRAEVNLRSLFIQLLVALKKKKKAYLFGSLPAFTQKFHL